MYKRYGVLLVVGILSIAAGVWWWSARELPHGWDPKWRGIERMVERGELVGLTRDDVVARYGAALESQPSREMVYRLGAPRDYTMPIDSDYLVLRLSGDRITAARIVTW